MLIVLGVAIIVGITLLVVLPGDDETADETNENTNTEIVEEPAEEITENINTETTEAVEADMQTFEIAGENYAFSQTEIRVQQGSTVKIILSSTEGIHDWVVDGLDLATTRVVGGGDSTEIEFTADTPGTYEYYCSVGNHRELGMVGNLIVE